MDAIQVSIDKLQQLFTQRMDEYQGELRSATPSANITSLTAEFTSFRVFIMTALQSLQEQVKVLAHQADTMEMRSRLKVVLLHGVPEAKSEVTAEVAAKVIAAHLKMPKFSCEDIARCHRMGRSATPDRARPILIRLYDFQVRNQIWSSKSSFKGSGFTLSEFLTKPRHEAFMAARQKFGVSRCWSREGFVFVLGPDDVRHRISSIDELEKIAAPVAPKPAAIGKQTAATSKPKRTGAANKK